MESKLCVHCHVWRASPHKHHLCNKCRGNPLILAQHKSTNRNTGTGYYGVTPCDSTSATPGSEAKVAILQERARLGQALWNNDDPVEVIQHLRKIVREEKRVVQHD